MATIKLAQNLGDAILYQGNSYEYLQQTTGVPDAEVVDVDFDNITGYTFASADAQGKTAYDAGEIALAQYEFGTQNSSLTTSSPEGYKIQFKLSDTTPLPTDDSTSEGTGYKVGSLWVDVTTGDVYRCTDATASNAVWAKRNSGTQTATSGGVFRIWQVANPSAHRINGSNVPSLGTSSVINRSNTLYTTTNGKSTANAWNLITGDWVETVGISGTGTRQIAFSFLPFVH